MTKKPTIKMLAKNLLEVADWKRLPAVYSDTSVDEDLDSLRYYVETGTMEHVDYVLGSAVALYRLLKELGFK